jgi:DNA helicase HerA-like ATPase
MEQMRLVPNQLDSLDSIGVVISCSGESTPNISEYSIILTDSQKNSPIRVRQGLFCAVDSPEGIVIGIIEQIYIDNEYFKNVQTVKNFDLAQINLQSFFPSEQWECHIARVKVLGAIHSKKPFSKCTLSDSELFKKIEKVGFPVKPGNKAFLLQNSFLEELLGMDPSGLNIGELKYQNLKIKLNLNRLFNKHVAILAQSGAGKSYLISVLLEELLMRHEDLGTPGLIMIDVHGEYRFLLNKDDPEDEVKEKSQIQKKIHHYNASFLQIGVPNLTEYDIRRYQPGISIAQIRELRKAIRICRKNYPVNQGFDFKDLIFVLGDDPDINTKVRETLVSWLMDLDNLHIFGKLENPSIRDLVKMGELTLIDLSSMISMRKKAILLHYFTSRLFYSRRNNKIPPFIIFLEEAHNFLPESSHGNAIAKPIFETIAREGRKFFAQLVLVSQRPVHLSTTALSQCNTQIILRVTNPYDLDHIKRTSEALTNNSTKIISNLPTGNALIIGAAVNYPVYLKVRQRMRQKEAGEDTLTDICKKYTKIQVFDALKKNTQSTPAAQNKIKPETHSLTNIINAPLEH